MADKLESLDESFASRLKEEVRKQFELAGFTMEEAQAALDRIGKIQTAPDWNRINAPRFADREIIPARIDPNRPVVNLYLTEEQKEDYANLMNGVKRFEAPRNVAAPFHEFVDKHPDAIARLSPDEFQLLGLLFKTNGGQSVISLYNQSKQ